MRWLTNDEMICDYLPSEKIQKLKKDMALMDSKSSRLAAALIWKETKEIKFSIGRYGKSTLSCIAEQFGGEYIKWRMVKPVSDILSSSDCRYGSKLLSRDAINSDMLVQAIEATVSSLRGGEEFGLLALRGVYDADIDKFYYEEMRKCFGSTWRGHQYLRGYSN
jgi:hypothetical protein